MAFLDYPLYERESVYCKKTINSFKRKVILNTGVEVIFPSKGMLR